MSEREEKRRVEEELAKLESLEHEFRRRPLDHDELSAQVRAWAEAFPDIVRLSALGTTGEGREIWMLELGPDPDRKRPTVWVDGNMHASELAGSSVALAIAEDVIRLHIDPGLELRKLSRQAKDVVRDVLFCVVPRISPDGGEAVLKTGRWVRSVPRAPSAAVKGTLAPRWVAEDIDGDGLALAMRVADPAGDFAELPGHPGLLAPRSIDDVGPFYFVYPEGRIENWDGETLPDTDYLGDNDPDLNRNFPWAWAPEQKQRGAGSHPLSELESQVVAEQAFARPELFVWLNLHTFGGVNIRPRGDVPDAEMARFDLAIYRQLEAWSDEFLGYPTVSGFEEFTYEPGKPLHGDLSDFAYHQRGAIAWVCELWDIWARVGVAGKAKRFVDRYTHLERDDLVRLAEWDARDNEGRVKRPWVKVDHPQLGPVEVGGVDPRFGYWNPPPDELARICAAQSAVLLRMAAMAPRVVVEGVETKSCGDDETLVEITVANHGYLPTHVLDVAREQPWNVGLRVTGVEGDLALLPGDREIGHLAGWGRGRFADPGDAAFQRSRGNRHRKTTRVRLAGRGKAEIVLFAPRVGEIRVPVEL